MAKDRISLEDIFSEYNITKAIQVTTKKRRAAGLDGMNPQELPEYWQKNRKRLLKEIENGLYKPTPALLLPIKKRGTDERRQIAVGSVLDAMIQNCIRFELEKYYTPLFHHNSYGFIKGRSTSDALKQSLCYMNSGMEYIVDADIRKCFDRIKHRIVVSIIEKAARGNVVELICKYLKNPGIDRRVYKHKRIGLPQGSCMSPVIANIVLNKLDWHLQKKGIKFVRYADDLVVFCKTKDDAADQLGTLREYLKSALALSLNEEKTSIVRPKDMVFLGYAFSEVVDEYRLSLSDSVKNYAIDRIQERISRHAADTTELLDYLGSFNRGWLNYYSKAHPPHMRSVASELEAFEIEAVVKYIKNDAERSNKQMQAIINSKGFVMPSIWCDELNERM